MEIPFTPEQEAQLSDMAHQAGTETVNLVKAAVLGLLEDTRFRAAVERGETALERGEYLTHEQVGQRIKRLLKS